MTISYERDMAVEFLCCMGIADDDTTDEALEPMVEHLLVLVEALRLYVERGKVYGEVWRQYGALSNLLSMARKVDRTMEVWWHQGLDSDVPMLHKDSLDDALDLLNYTCFFIRNARGANLTGQAPERPVDVPLPGFKTYPPFQDPGFKTEAIRLPSGHDHHD